MKTRMSSLSGDSLLQCIRDHFSNVTDPRDPSRIRIAISDFLMSGFSIFCLKFPSLLQFEEQMREGGFASRLGPMFKLVEVPSDTHMRSVLDEIEPSELAPIFKKLFRKVQESKRLEDYQFLDGSYLISIDGSQYYSSSEICCDSCMSKRTTEKIGDGLLYYHQMLAGCVVHPEQHCVIPLCPEPMRRQDGNDKNDCERAAMRRFLDRLREDHPKLKVVIVADALHATGPLIRDLRLFNANFILGVKPGSHIKLFEAINSWDERGKLNHFEYEEIFGEKIKKKRVHRFRYTNKILFNHADLNTSVNFLEYWEITTWIDPKGRPQETKVHFSWVTDYEINDKNIMQIMRGGRARWKIENETFNTLKNQGYEFEHNFGHGSKNLSTVFGYLMFLSFLFDQVSQLGCKSFQAALKHKKRLKYLRDTLRGWFMYSYNLTVEFKSWQDFLESVGPPKVTSTS